MPAEGTISVTIVRPRKARQCYSCDHWTPAGAPARYWVGRLDGELRRGWECAACCERYGRPITDGAASREVLS